MPIGTHNHPPVCCCQPGPCDCAGRLIETTAHEDRCSSLTYSPCPSCPDHGSLAPSGIECPQCRTEIGRPHTDFCTLAPGRVWDGVLPEPCAYPAAGPGDCGQGDCPKHRAR